MHFLSFYFQKAKGYESTSQATKPHTDHTVEITGQTTTELTTKTTACTIPVAVRSAAPLLLS